MESEVSHNYLMYCGSGPYISMTSHPNYDQQILNKTNQTIIEE